MENCKPLVRPFPAIGPQMRLAYRELGIAANGTPEQRSLLGNPDLLPRPWDPPTCHNPELREEIWAYLDEVVTWVGSEYVWDVRTAIPNCWPLHPHLVHEIAVLADQRHRAGRAMTSDPLEEWHRSSLPAFLERMRSRIKDHCEEGHQPWPARSRHTRMTSGTARDDRNDAYAQDLLHESGQGRREFRPRLKVVNLDTGEITAEDS